MDAKNCRKCGKLFRGYGDRNICSDCFSESLPVYALIREYLYDNPGSNAVDIIGALSKKGVTISHREILDFVKDDRLAFSERKKESFAFSEPTTRSVMPQKNNGGFHSKRGLIK